MSVCVVFVSNKAYIEKWQTTCEQLITVGKYTGHICLVVGNDLIGYSSEFIKSNNIVVKHFPDIEFPQNFLTEALTLPRYALLFQFHKFYLMDIFFKQWNYIFYIDSGMKIFKPVQPMIDAREPGALLANSDNPGVWVLSIQFKPGKYVEQLKTLYNLNEDYFQTGMMLYDTSVIKEDTFRNLIKLTIEYPCSNNNEQGIMALYFTQIEPVWKRMPAGKSDVERFYMGYQKREEAHKYIMLKYFY